MSFELSDNSNDNTIDVRDIIERVEDLRGERDSAAMEHVDACEEAGTEGTWDEGEAKWAEDNPDDARELAILEDFLSDLKGYGGDVLLSGVTGMNWPEAFAAAVTAICVAAVIIAMTRM